MPLYMEKWGGSTGREEWGGNFRINQDVRTDRVTATKKFLKSQKPKMKERKKRATCVRDKCAWVEHLNS